MRKLLVFLFVFTLTMSSLQVSSQSSEPNWVYVSSLKADYIRSVEITYGQMADAGAFLHPVMLSVAVALDAKVVFSGDVAVYNCRLDIAKCDQNKVRVELLRR